MAKEYDCDWDEVTSLNIVTFNHKLKYVEHLTKERKKKYKK